MLEATIEIGRVDDDVLDAFAVCPESPARRPPVLLLADRKAPWPAIQTAARRLAAHGYYVLTPHWPARPADERRDDVEAWFDHLADARIVDDARVGVVGYGAGADLALRVAAWRAERVHVVGAFLGRGFAPEPSREIAQRINGLIHLGYAAGRLPGPGLCALETALREAGVDFEAESYAELIGQDPTRDEGHWSRLLDILFRRLAPHASGTLSAAVG
jgi:carboxymethylenebutenolidase